MGKTILRTRQDCEDFCEGALWLGTGGGGTLTAALDLLWGALDDGLRLAWVDGDRIPDDAWSVTVGVHGSIAPVPAEMEAEIERLGLTEHPGEWYIARAVRELGAYLGHEFGCVVPAEIGPESAAISLVVGARLGLPVIDGDYIGRSVPEELQSTYCLYDKHSDLLASVDRWGSICIVKKAASTHALERIAKMLAIAAYGDTAVATTPLIARDMKQIVVPRTLTLCLRIGRALRAARESGQDPVAAVLGVVDGWRLFDGRVDRLETEDRDGYLYGTAHLAGRGAWQGRTLAVWFKNENQISWLDGDPWVCSPDLITLVHRADGRGIYNAELAEGDEVVAVGIKGVDGFRSERGLALAGPGHFGFDVPYVPIEELLDGS
ncbi:MAG: DUF917 domain-containing protein [Anaerolineae bacterium]